MSQKEKEVKQSAAEVENENLETEHTEADNGETSAGTENQEAEIPKMLRLRNFRID